MLVERTAEMDILKQRLERIFSHPDFKKKRLRKKIVGPIPGLDEYLKERQRIQALKKDAPEFMQVCYEEPILTAEQELHLFRRYNFHKYCSAQCLAASDIDGAFCELELADEVRTVLAYANMRLAISIVKRYYHHLYFDELTSEVNLLIIRCIDYFDWTRGFKFSTYATWAIRNNLGRVADGYMKQEKIAVNLENAVDQKGIPEDRKYSKELHIRELKRIIEDLMETCTERERDILTKRFFHEETLEAVGKSQGVTKERIRQLQIRTLKKLQERAEKRGLCAEVLF